MVYYIFQRAFVNNHGGRAAAIAVVLFVIVIIVSVLNFQLMRLSREAEQMNANHRRTTEHRRRRDHPPDRALRDRSGRSRSTGASSARSSPRTRSIRPYIELWPDTLTFQHYGFALTKTQIGTWYLNSIATALGVTVMTVSTSMLAGYAISQLQFPGRRPLWWLILASFMVPTQALIINHFVLMADMGLLNSWAGIILPQLIHPVVIIVYKQFFDQVPKDFREAAVMDNASEFAHPVQDLHADELGSDDGACRSSPSSGHGTRSCGRSSPSPGRR